MIGAANHPPMADDAVCTDSAGQPVTVRNGRFDTWGSLAGMVPQIELAETVLVS